MANPFIFWINEEPIRQHVSKHGRDAAVMEEIGEKVLRLATERNMLALTFSNAFGVFCTDKHIKEFFEFRMHLPDWSFLLWSGTRLVSLPHMTAVNFDALCQLVDKPIGTAHVSTCSEDGVKPIPNAVASVYWLDGHFVDDLASEARTKWPCLEMGEAVLSLMLDGESQASVRNQHPGICRACSFADHQAAVLVWGQNRLGCLAQIEEAGRSRIRGFLSDE